MKHSAAIGIVLAIASFPGSASAADPPRLEAVSVHSRTVVQSGSDILRYEYRLQYGGTELRLTTFEVDVSSDETRAVLEGTGLTFSAPHFRATTELSISELGAGRFVPVGSPSAPQFWASAVDPTARLRWGAIVDAAQGAPGSTVGPFVATSRGLPSIRDGVVGSNIVEFLPNVDETPGGIEESQSLMELGQHRFRTIGPKAPPAELDFLAFLAEIEAARAEAQQLSWIRTGAVLTQVDAMLAQLGSQLTQGAINPARGTGALIIATVEGAACTEFACPADRTFTSEARALLVENLRYLLSRLPETTEPLTATVWLGLKNSDDQGTSFDVRAELYRNGTLVGQGLTLCVAGITRNANQAKEVRFEVNAGAGITIATGDTLALKLSTRIGTKPDGTKCAGHSNAVGLRLYYDAASRASGLGGDLSPGQPRTFYLHSSDTTSFFFDEAAPTSQNPQMKDSTSIKFADGNIWKEIGTWTRTQP